MTGEKIRFRFRKSGALRLISHLDMMRCFERMLRRAAVPFRRTQGFHPYPRLVLAQSLPLGVNGLCEVGELELIEPRNVLDIQSQLNAVAPPGLELFDSIPVPLNATAIARRVVYTAVISADHAETVSARAAELLTQDKVWVERIKPRPRGVNIRPYLRDIRVIADRVEFDLWVTGGGTARIDELLRLLDLDEFGLAMSRTVLDIRDETEPMPGEPALDHPAELRPPAPVTVALRRDHDETPAEPSWGLSPAGPIVE